MIHSMSGGVIRDAGSYTFVKILFDGEETPRWYISEFDLEEGDRVTAPDINNRTAPATVVRVERNVSGQVTPVPVRRAKKIISKIVDR